MSVTTAAVIAATTRRPLPGPPSSNRCANRWRARAIRRDALSAADQLSLDLFVHNLRDTLRFEPFAGNRSLSMGALGSFESDFAELLSASPVERSPQVEQMRVRMADYPRRADQELARLREGMAPGWVPRTLLGRVLVQIDAQLAPAVEQGPLPAVHQAGRRDPCRRAVAFQACGAKAVTEQVPPALRQRRAFVADVYLPAAPPDGALSRYPGGAPVHATLLQLHTTTDLSAEQIHAIGRREVARLRGEMEGVQREVGFDGDFTRSVKRLNTDPKCFHTSPEALLAGYREIARRIDPELPHLFAQLPRALWHARNASPHDPRPRRILRAPRLDGTRPGGFNANAQARRSRPVRGRETLVAHEAVPGHHLQFARAVELGELPKFRRDGGCTVCGECWAVHAETLGFELGLYEDPYSRFGQLQAQAFRAARLVVDTGLHALGWTRQQASDFMVERTGQEPGCVSSDVDRYYSWPGQALA